MSVYCTWLDFEHPDQVAAELAADGITYDVIGDDSEQREVGSPYVYQGSHVVPRDGDPRGGWLEFGSIPNHCHPDADRGSDDMTHRVEFVRLGIREDKSTYRHDDNNDSATVVLDRRQVTKLRDVLTTWLDAEERW